MNELPRRIARDVSLLTSFTEDIVASGFRPGSRTVHCVRSTDPRVCAPLGCDVVVDLLRVRTADDVPVCIEQTYLPPRFYDLVAKADLSTRSLYALLEEAGERIARSEETLVARMATARELAFLKLEEPAPVASIRRLCFDEAGQPIELTENALLGDAYVFEFALRRGRERLLAR